MTEHRAAHPPLECWHVEAELAKMSGGHRNKVLRTVDRADAGNLVFKSTRRSEAELTWLEPVQEAARDAGFVVPRQIRGMDGLLCQQGWTCETFIDGCEIGTDDLTMLHPLVSAFHRATRELSQRPGFASSRDLLVRPSGGDVDLSIMPRELVELCRNAWFQLSDEAEGIIHGDLNTGNVLKCPDGRYALVDWDECRRDYLFYDLLMLGHGDEAQRKARRAWEIACSWKIEPSYARRLAKAL